jgi:hypothetical protein
MRTVIDDLPHVGVSRLRAAGLVRADDKTTTIQFTDPDPAFTFTVALQHVRFPNGGGWSFFVCSCGRRCRTLRLYNGFPACKGCLEAKGFRYRVEDMRGVGERAAYVAARLRERLASDEHARLKPHLRYSKLERRKRLEANLRRAELLVGYRDFVKPDRGAT